MPDYVRQALTIGRSPCIKDRTIDITTTGRRSGEQRRIEICFYRFEGFHPLERDAGPRVRLAGQPGPPAPGRELSSTSWSSAVRWPRSASLWPTDATLPGVCGRPRPRSQLRATPPSAPIRRCVTCTREGEDREAAPIV